MKFCIIIFVLIFGAMARPLDPSLTALQAPFISEVLDFEKSAEIIRIEVKNLFSDYNRYEMIKDEFRNRRFGYLDQQDLM